MFQYVEHPKLGHDNAVFEIVIDGKQICRVRIWQDLPAAAGEKYTIAMDDMTMEYPKVIYSVYAPHLNIYTILKRKCIKAAQWYYKTGQTQLDRSLFLD